MYCKNCGSEIKPGWKFCNNCGADIQDEETPKTNTKSNKAKTSKKKHIIISIITIILLLIIIFIANYIINTNKILKNIQNNDYTTAKHQIISNPFYSKSSIVESINVKLNNKYKIKNANDLSKINDSSWKEMNNLKGLLIEINTPLSQDLLNDLRNTLELEEYKNYVSVYKWYKDGGFEKWEECWNVMSYDIQSFSTLKRNLESYSFSSYNENAKYISDLEKIRTNGINYIDQLINAYNSNSSSKLETAKSNLTDLIYENSNLEIDIIETCDKMDQILKKLP